MSESNHTLVGGSPQTVPQQGPSSLVWPTLDARVLPLAVVGKKRSRDVSGDTLQPPLQPTVQPAVQPPVQPTVQPMVQDRRLVFTKPSRSLKPLSAEEEQQAFEDHLASQRSAPGPLCKTCLTVRPQDPKRLVNIHQRWWCPVHQRGVGTFKRRQTRQ